MDVAARQRKFLRTELADQAQAVKDEANKDEPSKSFLGIMVSAMDDMYVNLLRANEVVQGHLFATEITPADEQKEFKECRDIRMKYLEARGIAEPLLQPETKHESQATGSVRTNESRRDAPRPYKYPEVKLQKFSGELKNWIGWWACFKKIHEDAELDINIKFTFLYDAIVEGSRAWDVLKTYPPSEENYPKVVQALQERFGNKELLIDVYIRELLSLIIQNNSTQNKSKMENLSKLYDDLDCQLNALDSLGVTTDEKGALFLYPMVESCLPIPILRAWQRSPLSKDKTKNKLVNLMAFLKDEISCEQHVQLATQGFQAREEAKSNKSEPKKTDSKKVFVKKEQLPTAMGLVTLEDKPTCFFCSKTHQTHKCRTAVPWSYAAKKKKLWDSGRCFVCLHAGHRSSDCTSEVQCTECGGKHYLVFCPKASQETEEQQQQPPPTNYAAQNQSSSRPPYQNRFLRMGTGNPGQQNNTQQNCANHTCSSGMLYPCFTVGVIGTGGRMRKARVGIDSFCGASYIRQHLADHVKLEAVGEPMTFNHAVFGGGVEAQQHQRYRVTLQHPTGSYNCTVLLYGQDEISKGIPAIPDEGIRNELKERGITLSDNSATEIDILIGVDLASSFYTGRSFKLRAGPMAHETVFGWVVMGTPILGSEFNDQAVIVNSLVNVEGPEAYWKLETMGITDPCETLTKQEEDEAAMQHFRDTVTRMPDGRYQVCLPWISDHPQLPDNLHIAQQRLESATRLLHKNDKYEAYDNEFQQWLDMGIIEEVPPDEVMNECHYLITDAHYLSHRPVFNVTSKTTKIRPVFDASCHVRNAPSLNRCLVKGPNLLEKIPYLLLRFNEDEVAAIADIRKAFLMILIHPKDRDRLRFLWWKHKGSYEIRVFRHCRVVFGVNCSPFLLGAVLEHLIRTYAEVDPVTAQKLLSSLYVDNVVASFPNKEAYEEFRQKAVALLETAKFDLRLWESNVDEHHENEVAGVLGIKWNKRLDVLYCDAEFEPFTKITKRVILSASSRIFDPLGILAPVTVVPKMILQKCWVAKYKWDEEVDEDIASEFLKWHQDLPLLTSATIPRHIGVPSEGSSVHVFCDASKSGYAAVVFVRHETEAGVKVKFVIAKSRVCPVEAITINRAELLACEIGVRLAMTVKRALNWDHVPFHFWSDSKTALTWIERNENLAIFVRNRVKKILTHTSKDDWRYVPGTLNPADLPSRGCTVREVIDKDWWKGPAWLLSDFKSQTWNAPVNEDEVNAMWWDKFGSYAKLVYFVGNTQRIVSNLKLPLAQRKWNRLSAKEMRDAEMKLLKLVQDSWEVPSSFPLETEEDDFGLIRVRTKLTYRQDETDFKSPVLLPGNHHVSSLLIRHEHERKCHAGIQFLVNHLRERVWITSSRKAIGKMLENCLTCKRFKIQHPEPRAAPLPENRVRDAVPFEVTGVDYAGPLYVKDGDGAKVWFALYTCAVYRAIHLELVTSLSTEGFLMSLRRFIARRGRPTVIYCDNGTNFRGASNQLRHLNWDQIQDETALEPIKWNFSPPAAPWHGGFFERMVRSVKELLVRVLGKKILTSEELATVLCDIEAVVNGRPLTYVHESDTFVPITPAMFLQGVRETGTADLDTLDSEGFKKRHQLRQRLMEDLRQRFRKEYLGHLVQRKKEEKLMEIRPGDAVLIGSDNLKRSMWPMGVVQRVFQSRDGVQRLADVKTRTGIFTRAYQRLYPLELKQDDDTLSPEKIQEVVKTRSGRRVHQPIRFR